MSTETPLLSQPAPAPAARKVSAGAAIEWLSAGWYLLTRDWVIWLAIGLASFVVMLVLALIPLVGQLAMMVALPVAGGGLALGCRALERGEALRFEHLFAGLRAHALPLILVGVFYTLGALLLILLVGGISVATGVSGAVVQGGEGAGIAAGGFFVAAGVYLIGMMLLGMTMWFAPALVVLHEVAPLAAMRASLFACLKNLLAMLLFGLIAAVLGMLAMLPLGAGMVAFIPLMVASAYASHKAVFGS